MKFYFLCFFIRFTLYTLNPAINMELGLGQICDIYVTWLNPKTNIING